MKDDDDLRRVLLAAANKGLPVGIFISCREEMLDLIREYGAFGYFGHIIAATVRWNAIITEAIAKSDDPEWRQFLEKMKIWSDEQSEDAQRSEDQDGKHQSPQREIRHGRPFREGEKFG